MLSGGLMAAADASWDVEVSCQTMWEAFGPTFSPGSTTSSGAAYSFGWESECCPCKREKRIYFFHQLHPQPPPAAPIPPLAASLL